MLASPCLSEYIPDFRYTGSLPFEEKSNCANPNVIPFLFKRAETTGLSERENERVHEGIFSFIWSILNFRAKEI